MKTSELKIRKEYKYTTEYGYIIMTYLGKDEFGHIFLDDKGDIHFSSEETIENCINEL
jgi:hypothetical protein